MDGFIKMILGGGQDIKKKPLAILSQETDILFLTKRLDRIKEEHEKAHEEVCEKFGKEADGVIDQLNELLINKGLIKHKDEKVMVTDGVLYKVEVEDDE
ncbi:MAG: hypothetical protein HRU18_01345 [Pseudoalteromonas sp.]|uniref:hypothetical protein n=1 Tax=Pseudoalteromonas sp. TaxID=53249 RepID=UPI001D4860BC|nr:hypothetical protein [Pseudoalteromonas sp.]NRA76825.1 hypothetical protein [Pseudoalteromonas sp.]